jgi:hypothetical protein
MPSLLIQDNIALLRSAVVLVEQLDSKTYKDRQIDGKRSGIGPHLRHVLDHYQCFVSGAEQGFVDYDHREREDAVETDPHASKKLILLLIEGLEALDCKADDTVSVRMDCGHNNQSMSEDLCESSIGRELQFLVSHTVHHFAIIAIYCDLCGIPIPKDFGVAPSTIKHLSN